MQISGNVPVACKRAGPRIELIEARFRPDPEKARSRAAGFIKPVDGIRAQAVAVLGIVEVAGEGIGATIEFIQAATGGADPQSTVSRFADRRHKIVAQRIGAPRIVPVVYKNLLVAIKPIEAAVRRSHPQDTGTVDVERRDHSIAQGIGIRRARTKMTKSAGAEVELIQAAPSGSHPKRAPLHFRSEMMIRNGTVTVFANGRDKIMAQGSGVLRIVPVRRKSFLCRIEPVEAAGVSADPQPSSLIFANGGHPIIRQRPGIVGIILENREAITVVLVHPLLRAEPHKAVTVLKNGGNRALRQSLFEREAVKFYFILSKKRGGQTPTESKKSLGSQHLLSPRLIKVQAMPGNTFACAFHSDNLDNISTALDENQ
ncbi:MAG: hypothetical protein ONB51_20670 [candidate division KSB1 bacterium]|nr:hypothetical protein [candidate division KSB1 bacterium]